MRSTLKAGLLALATGALLMAPVSGASATERDDSLDIVGLVDGTTLVWFSDDDTDVDDRYRVKGLDGDKFLVGIDYRVQDGLLYGVGDSGGIYTLDDGDATKVGQLSIALDGESFGVDFNPAANALRVVSDTGQNLRQPFAMAGAATVADTPLTNPAVAPATGTVPALGVTGSAYTNNDAAMTTATTLFALDTTADRVAIQSPANAGTLAATGALGFDAGPEAGFDIYTSVDDDTATGNRAYATLDDDGDRALYAIDLLTGTAQHLGELDDDVTDIAIPLDQD